MNLKVDNYLANGCGRCPLGGTPQCKVNTWTEELETLRMIVLDSGLDEELKWGVPCYTSRGKNILIVSAFKEYCTLSFFKGSLLKDPKCILTRPGENSQAARQVRFTNLQDIIVLKPVLKAYIKEAIEIENSGLKVNFKARTELIIPVELQNKFIELPIFEKAFQALTPGRQRGYILFFTAAKQSATRVSRIEKYTQQIFNGKGINDR